MEQAPGNLQSLKLDGQLEQLPGWITRLQNLVKLRLFDTFLSRDGATRLMQDIGKLRNLSILSLAEYSSSITVGEVWFRNDLFMNLKVLQLSCAPCTQFKSLKFDDNAMPKLEVLCLDIGQTISFCGLNYLKSIKEIRVGYWYNPENPKESLFRELWKQLDEVKMGHLLKVL
jgi:hypothetical protein